MLTFLTKHDRAELGNLSHDLEKSSGFSSGHMIFLSTHDRMANL